MEAEEAQSHQQTKKVIDPGRGCREIVTLPIFICWEKSNLALEEAAAHSGIGIKKLREITNDEHCKFVLRVGNKRLFKRRLVDAYIEQVYSI